MKGFAPVWILLIVLVGAGLLGGGYFVYQQGQKNRICCALTPDEKTIPTPVLGSQPSPTPDPNVSWKTYTNDKYKYSIKYPQGWFIRNDRHKDTKSTVGLENEPFILLTPEESCNHCGGAPSGIQITASTDKNISDLKTFVEGELTTRYKLQTQLKLENTLIGGQEAFILNDHIGAGCPGPHAYLLNKPVLVEMWSECIEDKEVREIYMTFKFI